MTWKYNHTYSYRRSVCDIEVFWHIVWTNLTSCKFSLFLFLISLYIFQIYYVFINKVMQGCIICHWWLLWLWFHPQVKCKGDLSGTTPFKGFFFSKSQVGVLVRSSALISNKWWLSWGLVDFFGILHSFCNLMEHTV